MNWNGYIDRSNMIKNLLKKISSFDYRYVGMHTRNVIREVVQISRLFQEIKKHDDLRRLAADLQEYNKLLHNKYDYLNRFTESLTNMSALYGSFKGESDYLHQKIDEIFNILKYGLPKEVSVKDLRIEVPPPVSLETFYENQGLSPTKKPSPAPQNHSPDSDPSK